MRTVVTTWYDYTISLRATSRSGIAASEWSLGRGLMLLDPTVRCFRLDGERLVEVDDARELATAVYADPDAGLTSVSFARTWRSDVRSVLMSTLGGAAVPVIQSLSRARASVSQARSRVRALATPGDTRAVAIDPFVQRGDVVVTMGADWGGGLLDALSDLKAATGCRVVVMVYDLIPLTHTHLAFHKDRDLFERYYRRVSGVADLITCISESTRADLVTFARERGLDLPPAEVLHLGDTEEGAGAIDEVGDLDRELFHLWVGTIERRKNFELIYDALRILESEGRVLPTVVVAGSPGWGVDDILAEIRLGTTAASRSIVMLGGVPDSTLASLYVRARSLLFPSHYEGWGLPLREAAVRGCPVVAGETSASREALDGYAGAVFLSTDDPGPWADHLRSVPIAHAPAVRRTWADAAAQLNGLVAALSRGEALGDGGR